MQPVDRERNSTPVNGRGTRSTVYKHLLRLASLLRVPFAPPRAQTAHPTNPLVVLDTKRITGCLASKPPNIRVKVWPAPLADGTTALRANPGEELRPILLADGDAATARVL